MNKAVMIDLEVRNSIRPDTNCDMIDRYEPCAEDVFGIQYDVERFSFLFTSLISLITTDTFWWHTLIVIIKF